MIFGKSPNFLGDTFSSYAVDFVFGIDRTTSAPFPKLPGQEHIERASREHAQLKRRLGAESSHTKILEAQLQDPHTIGASRYFAVGTVGGVSVAHGL